MSATGRSIPLGDVRKTKRPLRVFLFFAGVSLCETPCIERFRGIEPERSCKKSQRASVALNKSRRRTRRGARRRTCREQTGCLRPEGRFPCLKMQKSNRSAPVKPQRESVDLNKSRRRTRRERTGGPVGSRQDVCDRKVDSPRR